MTLFPDTTAAASKGTDILGGTYVAGDKAGFILYQHDRIADGSNSVNLTNYVATRYTAYYYDVDRMGTVTQVTEQNEIDTAATELANIQAAVSAMMVDNELSLLITPQGTSTNDMSAFPDTTAAASKGTDVLGGTYGASDKAGFILFQHDRIADGSASVNLTNYVATRYTAYYYDVDGIGTVTQYETAGQ